MQGPPPSHRIGPSHCRCSQPGEQCWRSSQHTAMEHKKTRTLTPTDVPSHLRRGPALTRTGQVGTHVWQLTAGPGPPPDSDSRSAPLEQLVCWSQPMSLGWGQREALRSRHLVQSGHHLVPPLTVPSSHIALRAAVLVVQATNSLGRWQKRVV